MKIAYDHILRFLEDRPDIDSLSSKLFQLGHEHEIEDLIFDIEFTPNRGDCLSLQGLIRDLNVFYKTNLDLPIYLDDIPSLDLNFINKAEEKCPQISFLKIEIEGEISKYEDYLENYFDDLKIKKNNFFTDVSNYIAYELGQPTHSYDFSKIGCDITLQENNSESEFTTLLDSTINLKGSDLVFSSEKNIINLSGIMGGLETACTKDTKEALIECAYFKPESIIGKSVKYNLHSDASHKFERGTDPRCHEKVLRRFIQIVKDHSQIIKLGIYTYSGPKYEEIELNFDLKKINTILGLCVSKNDYKNSLTKLGFDVGNTIKIPSFRSDIHHQNDLAEELARVIGYDNIPLSNININVKQNKFDSTNEKKLKAFLINNGFIEVINSPFCSINDDASIKVDNPLDSNRENIRTNLTDSLIENLIYNEKRQKDSIKIFEISDIYTFNEGIQKEKRIAIVVSGRRGHNYIDFSQKLDKKYLSDLFKEIDMNIDENILKIDRNKINSKIKTSIFATELKIDNLSPSFIHTTPLATSFHDLVKYKPISEFPSSYRDFSFSIKDSSRITEVADLLSNTKSSIIQNLFMFDFYENKKTNETKMGYRFIFQSPNKTLTDDEINNEIIKIMDSVLSIESVSLPGS